jgi:hypothetical protein
VPPAPEVDVPPAEVPPVDDPALGMPPCATVPPAPPTCGVLPPAEVPAEVDAPAVGPTVAGGSLEHPLRAPDSGSEKIHAAKPRTEVERIAALAWCPLALTCTTLSV